MLYLERKAQVLEISTKASEKHSTYFRNLFHTTLYRNLHQSGSTDCFFQVPSFLKKIISQLVYQSKFIVIKCATAGNSHEGFSYS